LLSAGRDARAKTLMVLASVLVVMGSVILGTSMSAYAAASLTGSPTTGLSNGSAVTLTGTGFAKSSIGNVLECNSDPNQPTVLVGGLVNSTISVSCTAPSLEALVTTTSKGAVSTVFDVVEGTVGPPCGAAPAAATCPATDSAGNDPTADAALYPCPPTAAEQATGDVCQLTYGDEANDSASVNISFAASTTTTTAGATTTTTTGGGTTTTEGATTTTTTGGTTTTEAPTTTTSEAPTTTTTAATTTTVAPTTTTTAGTTTTTAPPTTITGAYELYCPNTPVGNIALNDAMTSATLSPAAPSAGQSFSVTGYQTMVNLPASLASAAASLGGPSLMGAATTQIDASGATPATTTEGPTNFSVPFPSPIPASGIALSLPSTAATVGGFTATSSQITIQEDASASLTITVANSPLTLTCTAYANDAVPASGITTATPTGSPIAPVIAVAGGGSTSTTTVAPVTTTTKAGTTSPTTSPSGGSQPVTSPSSSLAFTGVGPGVGLLGVIGGALILLGLALLVLVDAPRRALSQLAALGPATWAKRRGNVLGSGDRVAQMTASGRDVSRTGLRWAKQTGRWFLGR
jgi:hypothetical protein